VSQWSNKGNNESTWTVECKYGLQFLSRYSQVKNCLNLILNKIQTFGLSHNNNDSIASRGLKLFNFAPEKFELLTLTIVLTLYPDNSEMDSRVFKRNRFRLLMNLKGPLSEGRTLSSIELECRMIVRIFCSVVISEVLPVHSKLLFCSRPLSWRSHRVLVHCSERLKAHWFNN
jgi:hypothetical protein